ncbi:MAG: hypothetical protein EON57_18030, partial [Alphaproteobacteria bacterium]
MLSTLPEPSAVLKKKMSAPAPPFRMSSPRPPLSMLAPLLPVSVLARALPFPMMSALPVRRRFSSSLPRLNATE